jgi:CrcB protein
VTPLLVALGAAAGSVLRYLSGHWLDRRLPWGTLLVNVVGSFLLGALTGSDPGADALALLGTGFCGGVTTYSAFAGRPQARGPRPPPAVRTQALGPRTGTSYAVLTLGPSLAACALGFALTA